MAKHTLSNEKRLEFNYETLRNIRPGTTISADDIALLSGQNRVKGIHPIFINEFKAVAILCTIGGMNYSNKWLDDERNKLKYYLEGRTNPKMGQKVYNPNIKTNQSIINSQDQDYPVYVFVREKKGVPFQYEGQFCFYDLKSDNSGSYFELVRLRPDVIEEELLESLSFEGYAEVYEGRKIVKAHVIRERDPQIIKKAIQRARKLHGKLECEACNFNFEKVYGKRGEGFIEGHHIKPLSEKDELGSVTRLDDIALVCSNCHRMIHRKYPWLSIEELKNIINQSK